MREDGLPRREAELPRQGMPVCEPFTLRMPFPVLILHGCASPADMAQALLQL